MRPARIHRCLCHNGPIRAVYDGAFHAHRRFCISPLGEDTDRLVDIAISFALYPDADRTFFSGSTPSCIRVGQAHPAYIYFCHAKYRKCFDIGPVEDLVESVVFAKDQRSSSWLDWVNPFPCFISRKPPSSDGNLRALSTIWTQAIVSGQRIMQRLRQDPGGVLWGRRTN